MNGVSNGEQRALNLVDIIDFKWLMTHDGHHVHVERMQTDRAYANECIVKASTSSVEALRHAGRRIALLLSL